jgi:hypothetical protein
VWELFARGSAIFPRVKVSAINYLVDAGPLIGFLDGDDQWQYLLMDAGDATLVVLSELCPRARLITVDADFRHYRRFRNQAIPIVIPD